MEKVSTEEMARIRTEAVDFPNPKCALCGCTEDSPCFDGEYCCFWVTINRQTNVGICSACLGF